MTKDLREAARAFMAAWDAVAESDSAEEAYSLHLALNEAETNLRAALASDSTVRVPKEIAEALAAPMKGISSRYGKRHEFVEVCLDCNAISRPNKWLESDWHKEGCKYAAFLAARGYMQRMLAASQEGKG